MFRAASTIGAAVLGIAGGWAVAWSVLSKSDTPKAPLKTHTTATVPAATASPYAAKQRRAISHRPSTGGAKSAHRRPFAARTVSAAPPIEQPVRIVRMDSVGSDGIIRTSTRTGIAADVEVALARDIQKELRRVGCPIGAIDGDWGERSRSAMTRFVTNANASLPVDRPDVALLALLRNYRGNQCGATCPVGMTSNERGNCMDLQTARGEDGTSYVVTSAVAETNRNRDVAARPDPAPRPAPTSSPQYGGRRVARGEPAFVQPQQHMRAKQLGEGRMALGGLPPSPPAGTSSSEVTPVALPPVKPEPSTSERHVFDKPRSPRATATQHRPSRWSRRQTSYRKYRRRRDTSWRREAFRTRN